MDALATEYIDIMDVRHRVEHLVVPADDRHSREQILEELFLILVKPKKHAPA